LTDSNASDKSDFDEFDEPTLNDVVIDSEFVCPLFEASNVSGDTFFPSVAIRSHASRDLVDEDSSIDSL